MLSNEKIVQDPELGQLWYVTSHRAKRLNLTVKGIDLVRIAVPPRVSFKAAEQFIQSHRQWINKHQEKLRQAPSVSNQILLEKPANEKSVRQELLERLTQLAQLHGFRFNRVSFRNQKTRWGSCSRQNNISLNLKISQLPQHLQDYILLHELVHTKIKNHGPKFWQQLDSAITSNAKAFAKELRKYRLV